MRQRSFFIAVFSFLFIQTDAQQKVLFNSNWEFVKGIDTGFSGNLLNKNGLIKWEKISLPHTANIEPIRKMEQQWQGICFYRKFFPVPASYKGKHVAIQFDAAMQQADVYLNGVHIFTHLGGYLPFYMDVSDMIKTGAENNIVIKLDNRDNPLIPPGKPLQTLDFNYYSGIYRNAWLILKEKLYISDPVAAGNKAAGGVLIRCENVNDKSATVLVQTEVKNDFLTGRHAKIRLTLKDKSSKTVAESLTDDTIIGENTSGLFTKRLSVANPKLWSPDDPYLYMLSVELLQNGMVADKQIVKTGIKTVRFEAGAFYLNGKKIKIRGTNRHQEYPYLGNAASDNAQYRDAWKIKQAGFNFVRSSHYPQSPAYLDACDELGIMVMDAIPGWQFAGNEKFQQNSYQDIRDMIRRDRNHASVILWEASLNESGMKKDYMEKAHRIVHEELSFKNVYSAGWIDDVYDVFLPARQHGKAPEYWRKYTKNKPFVIAEYGDWEYYAQNAGFNQTAYSDLKKEERSSRQLRGWGEKRLLQQALNYQEAYNDNLYSPAAGDANWLMFDYNRGYAPDIESSGIMDIVRLPKFAFYFYQSQVDPVLHTASGFNKPMLFIANYWQKGSDTTVKIFSNCDEAELFVNGRSMGKQKPDKDRFSVNIKHPPFSFHLHAFVPGTLTAAGYINHKKVILQNVKTPGEPAKINLRADYSGKDLQAGRNDFVFVYAEVTDNNGTIVSNAADAVEFEVRGDAKIVGPAVVNAEAGIAAILVKAGSTPGKIILSARSKVLRAGTLVLNSK